MGMLADFGKRLADRLEEQGQVDYWNEKARKNKKRIAETQARLKDKKSWRNEVTRQHDMVKSRSDLSEKDPSKFGIGLEDE